MRHLEAYSFPGNVTELEAIVMRATAQVEPGAEVNADVFWFASQACLRLLCSCTEHCVHRCLCLLWWILPASTCSLSPALIVCVPGS